MQNDEIRHEISERAREHAADFDISIFMKSILNVAETFMQKRLNTTREKSRIKHD
jgi:hypothetical protein